MKKKIYFIQPTYRDQNGHLLQGRNLFIHSLALPALSAVVPLGWEKEVCFEFFEDVNYNTDASVIGISSMGYDLMHGLEIAQEFKKRGKIVIFGGYQIHFSKNLLTNLCDSIVYENPGPDEMCKILSDIETNKLLPEYHCGININFPFDYSLLTKKELRFMPVLSSIGCLNRCDFCCTASIYKGRFYLRDIDHVMTDLHVIRKKTRYVGFVDSNIYNNREYLLTLCERMINDNLGFRWGAQSTINIGDDQDALNSLKHAGCRVLFIGFETLEQDNLKWMSKRYKVNYYIEQIEQIRKNGISVAGYFMLGLDSDDRSSFQRIFDFIHKSRIALPMFNLLIPAPGTKIFDRLKKEGRLLVESEEDFLSNNPCYDVSCSRCFFVPKNMSIEEAETGYLELILKLCSFREIFHRIPLSNPFMAASILFMNLKFRKNSLAMAKAKR